MGQSKRSSRDESEISDRPPPPQFGQRSSILSQWSSRGPPASQAQHGVCGVQDRVHHRVGHSVPEKETQQCVTNYEKVCQTVTERLCKATTRQECQTVYEKSCNTVYKSVCVDQYKTEYEPYTETECSTEYKEDCEYQWEGHGNNKVWAPIPGTCKQNPYDSCKDVTKTKERQVSYPVCNDVPEEICQDVPTQQCRQVPDQVCSNQPLQQCEDVPREHCTTKHKKVPIRVSKNVPKKVCDTGYGYSANVSPVTNPEVVIDVERTTNLRSNKIVFAN